MFVFALLSAASAAERLAVSVDAPGLAALEEADSSAEALSDWLLTRLDEQGYIVVSDPARATLRLSIRAVPEGFLIHADGVEQHQHLVERGPISVVSMEILHQAVLALEQAAGRVARHDIEELADEDGTKTPEPPQQEQGPAIESEPILPKETKTADTRVSPKTKTRADLRQASEQTEFGPVGLSLLGGLLARPGGTDPLFVARSDLKLLERLTARGQLRYASSAVDLVTSRQIPGQPPEDVETLEVSEFGAALGLGSSTFGSDGLGYGVFAVAGAQLHWYHVDGADQGLRGTWWFSLPVDLWLTVKPIMFQMSIEPGVSGSMPEHVLFGRSVWQRGQVFLGYLMGIGVLL